MARERNPVLKGLLRIRRYNQQDTPYALQEVELLSWLQFGEAYSALRGWRPIPAALLSHSVLLCSGTEDNSLPTQRLRTSWSRPTQGKSIPDKHRSIRKKTRPVKSFATNLQAIGELYAFFPSWPPLFQTNLATQPFLLSCVPHPFLQLSQRASPARSI